MAARRGPERDLLVVRDHDCRIPGETVTIRPPDGSPAIRLTVGMPHYLIFQDLIIDTSLQADNFNPAFGDKVKRFT